MKTNDLLNSKQAQVWEVMAKYLFIMHFIYKYMETKHNNFDLYLFTFYILVYILPISFIYQAEKA